MTLWVFSILKDFADMQTELAETYQGTPDGELAQKILSKCVHCGFCTATCPTYQLLGDELDGPRGRIYLIKQMAEGNTATQKTREHLDRCLTCRNCESTCPSGVDYGHLIDIGRKWADEQTAPRPLAQRLLRKTLAFGLTNKPLFEAGIAVGRWVRPLLPAALQQKIPLGKKPAPPLTSHLPSHTTVLMLEGCVQPGMLPNINAATKRVYKRLGINVITAAKAGCCGAIKQHLNEHEAAQLEMKRNINAWWPYIEKQGVSTILMNASGCGATVKDYGHLLRNDRNYAAKAAKISALCKDLVELLPSQIDALEKIIGNNPKEGIIFHPPCTLQHGQQIKGQLEPLLGRLGIQVNLCNDSHLCCGSAGTYSILQAPLSKQLRAQKLNHLWKAAEDFNASQIVSANIGCITHLQNEKLPVKHWIELIDEILEQNGGYVINPR